MYRNVKKNTGFTLLELIVVISITGVLVALAVPSFKDTMRNTRLTTSTNELVTALNFARSEAIKREQQVVLRKTGTNWENGWLIFADIDRSTTAKENVFDDNGNGILCESSEDCILRSYAALPSSYILRGNAPFADFVRYQPDGTSSVDGIFALCDNSDGNNVPEPYTAKLIIVSNGRVHLAIDSNGNGIPDKSKSPFVELTSCILP